MTMQIDILHVIRTELEPIYRRLEALEMAGTLTRDESIAMIEDALAPLRTRIAEIPPLLVVEETPATNPDTDLDNSDVEITIEPVTDAAEGVVEAVEDIAGGVQESVENTLEEIVEAIEDAQETVTQTIPEAIDETVEEITEPLTDEIVEPVPDRGNAWTRPLFGGRGN